MKENKFYQVFAAQLEGEYKSINHEQAKNSAESLACRIPTLLSVQDDDGNERILAMCDISQSGGDCGRIQVVQRTSTDGGKTFGDMTTVLSLPVAKTPQEANEYHCAFAIDPVLCQCKSGDIMMVVDMFPESKAIMHKPWLYKGSGYTEVDGKKYLALYEGETKVGGVKSTVDLKKAYTVRENGWVYTPDGRKTKYYIAQKHSGDNAFETMGDMYYSVGEEGEYIEKTAPMMPEKEGHDIYVGNIYLSFGKSEFNENEPKAVEKRVVSPENKGELYSKYTCTETFPAPLSALPTLHLFMLKSSDYGRTWSQPVDISHFVKADDEIFLGTGPGVSLRLDRQKEESKNGRIIVPVYNLKDTFVIYSDDEGETWHRSSSTKNIDETQVIEGGDGTLYCFGRQKLLDKTPLSISCDGGESWKKAKPSHLTSVRCQKALMTLPENSSSFPYPEGMDKNKRYVVASTTTGWYQKKSARFGGVVTLGEIDADKINWLKQRKIITEGITGKWDNFYAYSAFTMLSNGKIGLLYEALPISLICFRSFTLDWLWQGEEAMKFPLPLISRIRRIFRKW